MRMKTSKGGSFPTSTSMPAISHLNNHTLSSSQHHHNHNNNQQQHQQSQHGMQHHVVNHASGPLPAGLSSAGVLHLPAGCHLPLSVAPAVESVIQQHQQQQQQMQFEVLRKRQYRVGLNVFNKGPPERGIQLLIQMGFIGITPGPESLPASGTKTSSVKSPLPPSSSSSSSSSGTEQKSHQQMLAASVAQFLLTRKGLSKQMIGQYLGNLQNSFNQLVLDHFLLGIELTGLCIDEALRKFQTTFRFPGETQQIERLVDKFADRYLACNPVLPRVRKSESVAAPADDMSQDQSTSLASAVAGDRISTTSSSSASFDPEVRSVHSLTDSAAVVMNRLHLSCAKSDSNGSTTSSCTSSSCASSSSSFCNLSHECSESSSGSGSEIAVIASFASSSSSPAAVTALNGSSSSLPSAGCPMTRDEVFILSFAIIMLNTDLYVPQNKARMTCDQWIRNLRGVFPGGDLSDSFLTEVYERIKSREIQTGLDHVSQVLVLQQQLLPGNTKATAVLPQLATPDRRLVCYCRLFEVPDITRRDRPGQHQREIFLFNDLLLITKLVYTKNPRKLQILAKEVNGNLANISSSTTASASNNNTSLNCSMSGPSAGTGASFGSTSGSNKKAGGDSMFKQSYSYRASYPLLGLMVKMFVSPLHPFGIKILRRLDEDVVMTFNARNAHDRNRFVMDLKESIEEMTLMDSSLNYLKNNNWKSLPLDPTPSSAMSKSMSASS